MSWPFVLLLLVAAAVAFLIGVAVGLQIYLLPQPRRFGFEVRDDE